MYIKMNSDKSLVITVQTTIYRGEQNADMITFLIPAEYEGKNVADCSVSMRYVLPDGTGLSDVLAYQPETYRGYLQYRTPANTRMTSQAGTVTIWLNCFDEDNNVLFKTGEAPVVIRPSRDISDYLPQDDLDQIDLLSAKIADLERRKADNIVFHTEDNTLQLLSEGAEIGDRIEVNVDECESAVYVPHIDEHKILTFTVEKEPGDVPDPVDLNPNDEWSGIDACTVETDYIWESM